MLYKLAGKERILKTAFLTFNIYLLLLSGSYCNIIFAQETSIASGHLLSVTRGLQSPVRITVDNQDMIYITDAYQKCIIKYNNSGEFLGTISPGGLPISIAVNDENQMFIGDGETGAILKLDENGTATEFCTETVFPSSMVFGPDNLLYVVDSKLKQVVVMDMVGNVVRTIGDGTLILPTGIGTGFTPVVKIWKFDLFGNLVHSVGSHGNGDGQFYRIQGLAVDRCGRLYTADPFQGIVSVFDEAGYITRLGEYGEESGQLNALMDVAVDSRGDIWITSMNNGSLEVFEINETNPSSNITCANRSICPGELTDITIDFTGTAPWTFTYTIDGSNPTTVSDATDNPYILTVSEAGIYQVTSLSDANYSATCMTGSVDISLNPLLVPEFSFSENYLEVSFVNESKNADSYFWDFGDNETSEEINPVHLYK